MLLLCILLGILYIHVQAAKMEQTQKYKVKNHWTWELCIPAELAVVH